MLTVVFLGGYLCLLMECPQPRGQDISEQRGLGADCSTYPCFPRKKQAQSGKGARPWPHTPTVAVSWSQTHLAWVYNLVPSFLS